MEVIESFVNAYERQFDYWEASAHVASNLLESELSRAGLRAIVTSRAKNVERLHEKLLCRDQERHYDSVDAISADIVDLAGVRVALYFPGQMDDVERIIGDIFEVQSVRRFPPEKVAAKPNKAEREATLAASGTARHTHERRFAGYSARHFRVLIPEERMNADQLRYASALIEIQVASVLMHAWSEVEHDLVYKPLEGELSQSECALLDQLNGLVLAGEIALEQLQEAGEARVTATETPFRDHYELADFIRARLSAPGIALPDTSLGRVDVLFDYLAEQSIATASSVGKYLDSLEKDFERRPVADQLADLMLSGNEASYKAYLRAMSASLHPSSRRLTTMQSLERDSPQTLALGEFVAEWVRFEMLARDLAPSAEARPTSILVQLQQLASQQLISPEQFMDLNLMRDLRNKVIHGGARDVTPERLGEAAARLRRVSAELQAKTRSSS